MENRQEIVNRPLAVVTGASSGIGLELAKVFAKNGYDLLMAAEDSGIDDAAASVRVLGARVDSVQVNLAIAHGVDQFYATIKSLQKPVDSLCLNAGVGVSGRFIETDWRAELNIIHLNIIALVHLTKHVLRDMVASRHGRILFTSSVAAEMPGPYFAVYAASKAFVQSFCEAIRYEVQDQGVMVTALQPGATETNFFARAHMQDTKVGEAKKDSAAEVAQQGFDALMANKDHVAFSSS